MNSKALIIRHAFVGVVTWLLLILGQNSFGGGPPGQWIVVTPPVFRLSLMPLVDHRKAEGFEVVVLETTQVLSPEQPTNGVPLQARLNQLTQHRQTRSYILLAGAFQTGAGSNSESPVVPAPSGAVGRMKGECSDFGYAFAGQDGAPTVSVGRFSARNEKELQAMVQKTLNFERNCSPAPWRNRLLLLLGNPGGGALAEMFVEQTLRKDLALLSPAFEVRTMFSASSSRYYLPWPQDRERALTYLREGQLFSVYLGHSAAQGMGLDAKFITGEDWEKLNISQGPGPFFTCGCFANRFGGTGRDGYGLEALRNPRGPVAVIGPSGESFSAPGQLAAEGLLKCLSQPPFPARLGDYWVEIQSGLARGKIDEGTFALLDMVDGSGGKVPLANQRLEHLEMWMLLGDPALRLPIVPVDIWLQAPEPITGGESFTIVGTLPDRLKNATVRLTLERPLDSTPVGLESLPPPLPENREARNRAIVSNFDRVGSLILTSAEVTSLGNKFTGSLQIPAQFPWTNLVLRACATVSAQSGLGVLALSAKARATPPP